MCEAEITRLTLIARTRATIVTERSAIDFWSQKEKECAQENKDELRARCVKRRKRAQADLKWAEAKLNELMGCPSDNGRKQ